jgi:hypothetical protein
VRVDFGSIHRLHILGLIMLLLWLWRSGSQLLYLYNTCDAIEMSSVFRTSYGLGLGIHEMDEIFGKLLLGT